MGLGQWTGHKHILTILPLGVVNGHADEYSKLLLGSITGCSPMTPIPLLKGECVIIVKKQLSNIRAWSTQLGASIVGIIPYILRFLISIGNYPMPLQKLNRAVWVISDSYSVSKEVLASQRLAPSFNVHTPNLNPDPLK